MISMKRADLISLKQADGEKVRDYIQRGEKLHDELIFAGGRMKNEDLLDCLKEGVLPKYSFTIQLYNEKRKRKQSVGGLSGALQAEEARLARLEGVRGDLTLPRQAAMVVTGSGADQQWAPKVMPNGEAAPPRSVLKCHNCGQAGHKFYHCPNPLNETLKKQNADFKKRQAKRHAAGKNKVGA